MIKVMVVEDEPIIGKTLVKMINNYGNSVLVVNYSINGKRALEYLENEKVDVVFSDIKMPVMDGLELMKTINDKFPNIITFITSGFQEFEYARLAMDYNVEKYLLKPISKNKLNECLDLSVKKIKNEKYNTNEVTNNNLNLNNIKSSNCHLIYICLGSFIYSKDNFLLDNLILKNYEKAIKIISEFLSNITNENNVIEESKIKTQTNQSYIVSKGYTVSEIALVVNFKHEVNIVSIGKKIYEKLLKELTVCVNVLVKNDLVFLNQIGHTFENMRKDLGEKIIIFSSDFWEYKIYKNNKKIELNEINKNIVLALTSKNENRIKKIISDSIKIFYENKLTQLNLFMFLKKIIHKYFENILNESELLRLINEIENSFSYSISLINLETEISLILYTYSNFEEKVKKNGTDILCEQVKDYININYKANITATNLGEKFNISPIHLSRRFKNEYLVSISEYCNKLRINIAKNIMINAPNIMIKEVGIEVGYKDQYYFSKIFKKIEGVWPSQFIKNIEKK